jgi:hypothetical protein
MEPDVQIDETEVAVELFETNTNNYSVVTKSQVTVPTKTQTTASIHRGLCILRLLAIFPKTRTELGTVQIFSFLCVAAWARGVSFR